MRELVIDSFAGGGGASEGIRAAIGRDPDIALNHDPLALAMHRINHPATHHIEEDVVTVDARKMCNGRPIGMLWMSPDCKDHSKAKGGKPRDKNIRGLAWTVVSWVQRLPKWQRPRVVFLENVEEFQDWSPLREDGTRCPLQRGSIFKEFVRAWQALGYVVEYRKRRACNAGAPTIRQRLYMIMRRDGLPIVWPDATHGDPKSEAALSGGLKPWRTTAEIIDWSLPCPSIFDTSEEIKAKFGIRAIRPLADNTMARLAKGTMRYVVTAAKPFIVRVNHGDSRGRRDRGLDEPLGTLTAHRGDALVTPFVSYAQQGGRNRPVDDPLHTLTASRKDQDQVVAPIVVNVANGQTTGRAPNVWSAEEPLRTITQTGTHAIVAPFLAPRYQEKLSGQPRVRSVEEPAATIIGGDNVPGYLAAVHLSRQFGASVGSAADEPVGTITAGGAGKAAVVAAFLAQHNNDSRRIDGVNPGQPADRPMSTITATGGQQGLVAAYLLNLRGSDRRGGPIDAPAPTISAGGNHAAAVTVDLSQIGELFDGSRVGDGIEGRRDGNDPGRSRRDDLAGSGGEQRHTSSHLAEARGVPTEEWLLGRGYKVGGTPVPCSRAPIGLDDAQGHNSTQDRHQPYRRAEAQQFAGEPGACDSLREPPACVQDRPAVAFEERSEADHRRHNSIGESPTSGRDELLTDRNATRLFTDERISRGQRVAAFLQHYYGTGGQDQRCDNPLHTVTTKPRHGLVTVTVEGEPFVIVDIGMRMLTPRERFNAQSFRPDYVIDHGLLEDGSRVDFTLEQQGRMCGNSVCPVEAAALVAANYAERPVAVRRQPKAMPLLQAAE